MDFSDGYDRAVGVVIQDIARCDVERQSLGFITRPVKSNAVPPMLRCFLEAVILGARPGDELRHSLRFDGILRV